MSRCSISTGSYVSTSCGDSCGGTATTVQGRLLFDGASTSKFTEPMTLAPGNMWLIQAFNLAPTDTIKLNMILPMIGAMAQGKQCEALCKGPGGGLTVAAETQVITNGRAWEISATDNSKILLVPGKYRFELSDDAMIGEAMALLTELNMMPQPEDMLFGQNVCVGAV